MDLNLGTWLVAGVVFVLVIVFIAWVVWPPPDPLTSLHEVSFDLNMDEMPVCTVDPMIRCRVCRVPIRHVTTQMEDPTWMYPLLTCPDCGEVIPVVDWPDRSHIEVLLP